MLADKFLSAGFLSGGLSHSARLSGSVTDMESGYEVGKEELTNKIFDDDSRDGIL